MSRPPAVARRILELVSRLRSREAILGDFDEFFHEKVIESGLLSARIWYWKQALKSMPRLLGITFYWRNVMFKNYLKISLRNIAKQKVFSLINIVGLAFSLSICLFVIQVIFSIYSIDRYHTEKDRIVRVISLTESKGRYHERATAPLPLADLLENDPDVEAVSRIKKNFSGYGVFSDRTFPFQGYYADPNFFKLFDFNFESGDPASALEQPYSLVVTRELADKFFPEKNPVGEIISAGDLGDFKITGVLSDTSRLKTHLQFECLASISTLISLEKQKKVYASLRNWKNLNDNYVYFLRRRGAPRSGIRNRLPAMVKPHYPEDEDKFSYQLQALTDISPGRNLSNSLSPSVPIQLPYLFSAIALIMLLIAAFNYTNLSLAKGLSRAREVGVRKVVGASRSKIFGQFIGEAIILSLIALFFAVFLLELIRPFFLSLSSDFQRYLRFSTNGPGLWLAFFLFTVLAGIVAGLLPAHFLSKFKTVSILKNVSNLNVHSKLTLRKSLVVFQFFISFVLIISTVVLYRQLNFELNMDRGFTQENIINVELQSVNQETLKQEIASFHRIKGVSSSAFLPSLGVRWLSLARLNDQLPLQEIDYMPVDRFFLENLNIKLVAGADFPQDAAEGGERYAIINEKAVSRFDFPSNRAALGQVITFEEEKKVTPLKIIGVVADFCISSTSSPVTPLAFRVIPADYEYLNIKTDGQNMDETIAFLEEKWRKVEPVKPLKYNFFEDQIQEFSHAPRNMLKGIGFLSFLAVLVAFFGLLGMVIFDTRARTKEIGIRKVMGASVGGIIREISKGFLTLLILAAALATPVAWLLNSLFLQTIANRIQLGWEIFALAIGLTILIGFIIIFSQTVRAARANPVDSLRYE